MGWNGGADILGSMAIIIKEEYGNREPGRQTTVLGALIPLLEDQDCDVLDECFGITPACDEALKAHGYHMVLDDCFFNEDYTRCSCGWREE